MMFMCFHIKGDLRLRESRNISFSLTNYGDSASRFTIVVSDGYRNISVQSDNLEVGEVYNGVVLVTPQTWLPM
jgi:hypothetical protein